MDFMQRGDRPSQPAAQAPNRGTAANGSSTHNDKKSKLRGSRWVKFGFVAILFSVAILIIAVSVLFVVNDRNKNESGYVDTGKMQAVFLNGGQVYFGKITTLNSKYLRVADIYYLRVNQTVQPNQSNTNAAQDVSLVKLGCELHGPTDEMLINRDQVVFWENLKSDGQVAKAVAEYRKQNPNGQKCDTQSSSNNGASNTNGTTSNGSSNSSSTNSTTTSGQ